MEKKLKLAVIYPGADLPKTGGQFNILLIADKMRDYGIEISVICRKGPIGKELDKLGIEYEYIPERMSWVQLFLKHLKILDRSGESKGTIQYAFKKNTLSKLISKYNPEKFKFGFFKEGSFFKKFYYDPIEVFNCSRFTQHIFYSFHIWRLAYCIKKLNPDVCFVDLPMDQGPIIAGASLHKKPTIWYVQISDTYCLDEYIKENTDHMISCGKNVGNMRFGNYDHDVIINGVDPSFFRPQQPTDEVPAELKFIKGNPKAKIIGTAGSLIDRKRPFDLVNASKKLLEKDADLHLVFLGNGKLMSSLQKYVKKIGLEKQIHLLGKKKNIEEYIRNIDVFAFPSVCEGLPYVLIEAMSSGIPCVSYDIPECKELLEPNYGVMVPSEDVGALSLAIESLVYDEGKMKQLAERGREKVLESYTREKMLESFALSIKKFGETLK